MKMKKVKKIKSGFLAVVLGLSMMMAAVPGKTAEAADTADSARGVVGIHCSGNKCNLYTTNRTGWFEYCLSTGDESHNRMLEETFTCTKGHTTPVTSLVGSEPHTWNTVNWESLNHWSDGDSTTWHSYRIHCTGCGYEKIVTLICNYESRGYHNTPF